MRPATLFETAECEAATKAFAKKLKTRAGKDAPTGGIEFSGNVTLSDDKAAAMLAPEREDFAIGQIKNEITKHQL